MADDSTSCPIETRPSSTPKTPSGAPSSQLFSFISELSLHRDASSSAHASEYLHRSYRNVSDAATPQKMFSDIQVAAPKPIFVVVPLDLGRFSLNAHSSPPHWYAGSPEHLIRTHPLVNGPQTNSIWPSTTLEMKSPSTSYPPPLSPLDIVPYVTIDLFQPLPLFLPNRFDHALPKELRLAVFLALLDLYDQEHQRVVSSGQWTMAIAVSSRNRWVGRDKGLRDLFKLGRVSKAWRVLVLDGQLWKNIDLHSFPGMPVSVISTIVENGGTFATSLNLAGHTQLQSSQLIDLTDDLCLVLPGCVGLSTESLHYLLMRSRFLQKLNVKGLPSVTNVTCDILATFCRELTVLNMSRCSKMDAEGIIALANATIHRHEHLRLVELRLSGLRNASDALMRTLGRAAPFLEVLDLTYVGLLENSALEAFIACDEDDDQYNDAGVDTMVVGDGALGRDASGASSVRRRVTRVRHIALSFCPLLTDMACAHLAYAVPRLEILELAGIGADLKDEGLIRLVEMTPDIRKIDLENAMNITDAFLRALTPAANSGGSVGMRETKQTGHALEHLAISYAGEVSDDALMALVRGCPKLRALEVDNTTVSSRVLQEFVKLARERGVVGAQFGAVDCRWVREGMVKEVTRHTRPRAGWRGYGARRMGYVDGRDGVEEELRVGQDECDERRIVLKTFYSWQTVDAVQTAREKRGVPTRRVVGGGERMGTHWWSGGQEAGADVCRAM